MCNAKMGGNNVQAWIQEKCEDFNQVGLLLNFFEK